MWMAVATKGLALACDELRLMAVATNDALNAASEMDMNDPAVEQLMAVLIAGGIAQLAPMLRELRLEAIDMELAAAA